MLATLGDLVEDVVVRIDGPINVASDTPARISRRRGGSAANVAVAGAALGVPCRFLGQVGVDAIGDALLAEMASAGVDVTSVRRSGSTGTIVALVDATGERSMLTDRRACVDLTAPEPAWLDGVTILHVPLYSLADGPVAATAATVVGWAHDRRIDVAIDVSSTALIEALGVDRVRALLDDLRPGVVFANRDEAAALSIDGPIAGSITVVKRGPDPAIVFTSDALLTSGPGIEVPGITVSRSVDTTGAGDAFAAGFLLHPGGWIGDPIGACVSGHRSAATLLRARDHPPGADQLTRSGTP
jgi:sugar/nucleoside kinase (ribokinase family)